MSSDTIEAASGSSVPAIALEGVEVTYRQGGVAVGALRGVTMAIPQGEFLAIQGPSGSGKSTLLRVMAGLCVPDRGRVVLDGIPISERSDTELAELRRRRVGFVHQLFNLLPDLTAAENVGLPLLLDGITESETSARVQKALEALEIAPLADRRPEELSGGEMLRVAIARALAIEPLIILADEPTGSLDSETGRRVLAVFKQLHERGDVTLVIVTHDPVVAAAARRTVRFVDGQLVD